MKNVSLIKEYTKGLWDQNPTFKQILGTCPTLAVTVSAMNGVAMALATTFVLVFSSMIISMIRKLIPNQVRIAAYIVIVAGFVTIVDLVMKAQFPAMSKSLGPYIPLIVVNCIILGRAEAFASKNGVLSSFFDGLGIGLGFTVALTLLGAIRELLGTGKIFSMTIFPENFGALLFVLAPGAFIALGYMIAIFNKLQKKTN
jgi:electron transport complex protein RnfE